MSQLSAGAVRGHHVVLLDQILSSGTNFVTFVAVGAATTAAGFGAFSIGAGLFAVALGAARATSSERVAIGGRNVLKSGVPASLLWIIGAQVLAAGALVWISPSSTTIVWVVAGPASLFQDRLRYIAFAVRPVSALLSDGVWFLLVVAGGVVALHPGGSDLIALILAAVGGPVVGLLTAWIGLASRLAWSVERDAGLAVGELPFVLEGWLLAATVFAVLALVGSMGSLEEAGHLRILLLVFQPFFSLAVVGRWRALTDTRSRAIERWPGTLAVGAAVYGMVALAAIGGAEVLGLDVGVLNVTSLAFLATMLGQVARAYHQGVADLARRLLDGRVVVPRAVFAIASLALLLAAKPVDSIAGWAGALALGFGAGGLSAFPLHRRLRAALAHGQRGKVQL